MGSAEWNLLTDEASWSAELYRILGRAPTAPPLTLDELPSVVLEEDRPALTAMVTDCLVDARPIDGEFRIVRPDGEVRTVHMMGEPVLDADGATASMWAVLRDVSALRRSEAAVSETRDSLRRHRQRARTEQRVAVELQEAVLPRGAAPCGSRTRDPAASTSPATICRATVDALVGGDWYDAVALTDGDTLLSVGDLTGHGPTATSNMATLLGAVRGMAMAGTGPGRLLGLLNELLDTTVQPALGSALCCRYRPATRTPDLGAGRTPRPAAVPRRDGTPARPAGRCPARRHPGRLLRRGRGEPARGRPAGAVHRRAAAAP
ncbi:hypothetical protein GCM10020256_71410 [Streptomyces thermocoprophilus]